MKPTPSQIARAEEATQARQISIEDWLASQPMAARGATCEAEDVPRLSAQCLRVYGCLRNLKPWTLAELSASTGDPMQSCSARWREIRRYLREGGKGDGIRLPVKGRPGLFTYEIHLGKHPGAAV